jgi:hypothetical protein
MRADDGALGQAPPPPCEGTPCSVLCVPVATHAQAFQTGHLANDPRNSLQMLRDAKLQVVLPQV